jgi:tetratricopeptide (TPR) repeat protein
MRRHSLIGFAVLAVTTAILIVPSARADWKQAVAHYSQGKYLDAINDLKDDMANNPEWESGHRLLGLCYLRMGNNALAASELSRAAELKSPAFVTYFGLGQAQFSLKKYDKCISALNAAEPLVAKEQNQKELKADLYALRGKAYYTTGKYNEAVSDLKKAIGENQSDWMTYNILGDSYFKLNNLDEAIQYLEKAHSMKSSDASITANLGKVYLKQGIEALKATNYDLAIKALSKAKDYNSKDGVALYNLGEAYFFKKDYPKAEEALAQAMNFIPKNADAWGRLGLVYENQKKFPLALEAYTKADTISPTAETKKAIERVKGR